jgi:hypothetical protein
MNVQRTASSAEPVGYDKNAPLGRAVGRRRAELAKARVQWSRNKAKCKDGAGGNVTLRRAIRARQSLAHPIDRSLRGFL